MELWNSRSDGVSGTHGPLTGQMPRILGLFNWLAWKVGIRNARHVYLWNLFSRTSPSTELRKYRAPTMDMCVPT